MKPRVVSKNAKAKARQAPAGFLKLRAASGVDGVADTKPARVTGAGGVPIRAVDIIGRVGRTYRFGHKPTSGEPIAFSIDLIDAGGAGFGTAQKQGAFINRQTTGTGGSLNIQGTFVANKYGKKGKVLGASGGGYVVNATGAFAGAGDAWYLSGTPVSIELDGNGRNWLVTPVTG